MISLDRLPISFSSWQELGNSLLKCAEPCWQILSLMFPSGLLCNIKFLSNWKQDPLGCSSGINVFHHRSMWSGLRFTHLPKLCYFSGLCRARFIIWFIESKELERPKDHLVQYFISSRNLLYSESRRKI